MINELPLYISLIFCLTTFLTVWFLYKASGNSPKVIIVLLAWLIFQGMMSLSKFYLVTDTIPPRFIIVVPPTIILILILFFTNKGKSFIDGLNPKWLTLLHVVRVPVELVLFWLFLYKQVPQIMTFEGRNFDIISGITAPLIAYFGFVKKSLSKTFLMIWNVICLGFLLNIVDIALLSAPSNFQQLSFEQPNVAVLYFPFIWLPACVVPIVLFSHLATIRYLLKKQKDQSY